MNRRRSKALWVLLGILLVACLLFAGPAHNVLHHDAADLGSCDVCHLASPQPVPFEPIVSWLATRSVEPGEIIEHVRDHLLAEQGNARAPPAAG